MLTNAPSMERLIEAFRLLPGVGKRSAERYALHLLSAPEGDSRRLSEAIQEARRRITTCSVCCDLTETDPCSVCGDERRDHSVVCVVERPSGAMAIEKGGSYRGLYHVLHGVLNPIEGIGPSELTVGRLVSRVEAGEIREVIVATNATAEGEGHSFVPGAAVGGEWSAGNADCARRSDGGRVGIRRRGNAVARDAGAYALVGARGPKTRIWNSGNQVWSRAGARGEPSV